MSKGMSILVLGAVVLAGCNPESPRTGGDGELLTAGIPGAAAAAVAEQDSTPMVVRRVWGGQDVDLSGSVSPDGRYLTFIDWSTCNLAVRELATGEVRLLTDEGGWNPDQSPEGSAVSPDGRWVVYQWYGPDSLSVSELRIVGMDGTGLRSLYNNHGSSIGPGAWSPDGEQVVAVQSYDDGTAEMLSISVADGSVRTLKSFESSRPAGLSFSPDGRFIVYHYETGGDSQEQRDIFVFALGSGREMPLIQNPADDYVLGWAPDGNHILFASDRTGTVGAWLLPVADGKAAGEPKLVKPDMWRVHPVGFTRDGAFFYGVNMTARDVYVASIDPETGELLMPPASVHPTHLAYDAAPAWSPDGRYLLYRSRQGRRAYWSIRSVETGETRELIVDLKRSGGCLWWIDGHSLLCMGRDYSDRRALFLVDMQTGEAEPLPSPWDVDIVRLIGPSPDGKAVYYYNRVNDRRTIAVTNLETGRERLLFTAGVDLRPALSPDGRYLAFAVGENDTHRLLLMPAAGGEPRELLRYQSEGSALANVAWSSDGKYVFYPVDTGHTHQLWRVSLEGGPPQRLDLEMPQLRNLRVHPDGQRIAFDSGSFGAELWVMENFLPGQQRGE